MAASSPETISEIFRRRIKWLSRPDMIHDLIKNDSDRFTHSYLSEVIDLILNSRVNSGIREPIISILWEECAEDWEYDYESFYYEMGESWTPELQELFMVPMLEQLYVPKLKKHELLAAFITFLVQLLSHGADLIFPVFDFIDDLLEKLMFLIVVLGDISSPLWPQIEDNFLAEFEAVANEAGSLMYSLFFVTDLNIDVTALIEHIELLKANIIKFPIISSNITAVDSFSVIASVLLDLEQLMNNRADDLIVSDIKILHQGLQSCFLKDIKLLRLSELDELDEVEMRVRDVAYESEYLINSFMFGDAPIWYLNIRIPHVIHKIQLIETGLQEIEKNYDMGSSKVAKHFSTQLSLQAKRDSDAEDIIVGLEDKTVEILDQLIGGQKNLQFITIFGMPGLGKTTLAKKLYFHPSVNCYFDKLSWCIVSQAYHRKSILTDILIGLQREFDRDKLFDMEEESIVVHIHKCLYGRRYLIVMDDIWNSNVWDDLQRCFPDNRSGSRILFTSRNQDVAPRNSIIHELPTLSNGQCWELLQKKVFGDETCPLQLLDIGNQIAVSCCGLPLAVVVVAGILLTMDGERNTWENVGTSLASYIFANKNNSTMKILELSYKHLPDHLKPCFLYFGAFGRDKEAPVGKDNSMMPIKHGYKYVPNHVTEVSRYPGAFWEDKEIHVRTLIRLWIAEGFIRKKEGKSLECVAEEYLMELIGKSLVIVTAKRSDGGVKKCLIHDLFRELCSRRAEEENFLKLVDNNYSICTKHQRLYAPLDSVSLDPVYSASDLQFGLYGLHVRSFIGYVQTSLLNVVSMELLRVLDCWNTDIDDLDVTNILVHLRYLAITTMPASIDSLVNLEFLVVHKRVTISSSLLNMVKLRYLQAREAVFAADCINSSEMVINNLEYLSTVCIFNLKDENMLRYSPHLQELKCECEPIRVKDEGTSSYRYPDLRFLTQLESLSMAKNSYGDAKDAKINFPLNIKKLSLYLLRLPWETMSIIGVLPKLEILKLEADAIVGKSWETRDAEFQQLRILKLVSLNLFKWEVSSSEHFPKLQQLVLQKCWNLQEIPSGIGEIETLQLIEVNRCRKSVADSAIQIEEEQRDMGNEDLRIIIRN